MDNSSRNIVTFIATITFAAMLIMAARYYAMSGDVEALPVAEDTSAAATPSPATSDSPEQSDASEAVESEVIEEDYEVKMGEPTVDIGTEVPTAPPPALVPAPETPIVSDPQPAI